jgi:hypothetical protein
MTPSLRRLVHRPWTAGLAAIAILVVLAMVDDPANLPMLAVFATAAVALASTTLDPRTVRFEVAVGHSPANLLMREGRPLLCFAALAILSAGAVFDTRTAVAILATAVAGLYVMALRLFGHVLHAGRFAETLVAMPLALLATTALAAPMAAAPIAAIMLASLWRRASRRTWLLT